MSFRILIIGADGGIGSAMTRLFSSRGWHLQLGYHSCEPSLADNPGAASFYSCRIDVRNPLSVADFMNKLCSENIGTPDVFVYNSGIFVPELCINNSSDRLQQTIDVNLKPAVDFIREIAPQMMMRKKGKIFLMSSVNGRKCFYNGHANYAISKAGLDALVRQAAMEFSRHGILINAIAPGMVETEMTRNYLQEQKSRNRLSQLLDRIALHRLGRAEEIANFVFALSQPEVDYITGQTFCIDGGFQL